jgi:hypothetical protein
MRKTPAPTKRTKVQKTTIHKLLRQYLREQGLKLSSPRVEVISEECLMIR